MLAFTKTKTHVHPAVLGQSCRDVIVVGGGDLHNPPEVLAHLGWGARVGLVPDPQLAVAIGAPVVQDALVVAESKLPVVSLAVHLPPILPPKEADTFLGVDWWVVVPDLIFPQLFWPQEKMSPSAVR